MIYLILLFLLLVFNIKKYRESVKKYSKDFIYPMYIVVDNESEFSILEHTINNKYKIWTFTIGKFVLYEAELELTENELNNELVFIYEEDDLMTYLQQFDDKFICWSLTRVHS